MNTAYAHTVRWEPDPSPKQHERVGPGMASPPEKSDDTAGEYDTARISEQEALEALEAHKIPIQIVENDIEALSSWTAKHDAGGFGSEWVRIVLRRDWLRAFLGCTQACTH